MRIGEPQGQHIADADKGQVDTHRQPAGVADKGGKALHCRGQRRLQQIGGITAEIDKHQRQKEPLDQPAEAVVQQSCPVRWGEAAKEQVARVKIAVFWSAHPEIGEDEVGNRQDQKHRQADAASLPERRVERTVVFRKQPIGRGDHGEGAAQANQLHQHTRPVDALPAQRSHRTKPGCLVAVYPQHQDLMRHHRQRGGEHRNNPGLNPPGASAPHQQQGGEVASKPKQHGDLAGR